MMRNVLLSVGLIIVGILTGWISWNTSVPGFCILPLVVVICFLLPKRTYGFLFIFGYYLGSAFELLWGAVEFFHGRILVATCLWLLQQFILATAWIIIKRREHYRFTDIFFQITGTFLITVFVPPYCLLGIANPMTAAGFYFPTVGYLGLGLFILLISMVVYLLSNLSIKAVEKRKVFFVLIIILMAAAFLNVKVYLNNTTQYLPQDWVGVDTRLGRYPVKDYQKIFLRHLELKALAEQEIRKGKKVIIFPESVAGFLIDTEKYLWQDIDSLAKKQNVSILLGGYLPVYQNSYENALFAIGNTVSVAQDGIVARISMPVTNWRLFLKPSAALHIDSGHDGVFTIASKNVVVLICYEQMLVWPVLQSMFRSRRAEMIVAVSNVWWAKNTRIPEIMDRTCRVWGRLFNVPVLRAVNI